MGGHVITWAIFLIWPNATLLDLFATLELFLAILLFVIFVWKDDVRRAIREQFARTQKTSKILGKLSIKRRSYPVTRHS